ncbi:MULTISPECIES: outer membrane lipoprotein carrier protein LolA [unclassified Novosphingobium]|uniref:LolA family protein n=1 Tax=unclassified Novosphingobium TaxID=2644732 RepID=UPI001444CA55|nr:MULTISPECIES: outer membrane lipoprotein carrier protein LolA [unclassified Novosphingobium]NKJ43226.1 outer membrane lipoprotein-sorting protein [Novosphingobium sp. SG720]NMN07080.1 outer membrane lipoprotein-sorting protein [Novosphingobium sp. SG919]NMN89332.1 outer membrane lipoprotein-sorting protein [Novosphingobium sp. SG916]
MNSLTKILSAAGLVAALSVSPALAPALAAPAPAAAPSSDVERAVAALRAISSLRADFVQTDRNGQRLTGTLTLQRPGKIRFQYQPGVPLLIVSDGAALTVIDYEVRQVSRWPIRNSPLGALLNPDKDVARYARLLPTTNPDVISLEIKDPRHPEYGTLTLIMVRKPGAPGGLQLDSWVALDSQNQRTTIRLSNQQYGVPVPANMFRYNDPRPQVRH